MNKYKLNFSTNQRITFLLGFVLLFFSSCNPTKHVGNNELFLKKNSVKIEGGKLDKDEVNAIIKQKPNRKILGVFRFHLGVYNLFGKGSESKIKQNVGEPPVVFDSLLANKTQRQLELYAKNKGYFDGKASYSTKIKNKKIKIDYHVVTGEPYKIKSVKYQIDDNGIKELLMGIFFKTYLKKGTIFDTDVLDDQREKIKTHMRNEGYYYFSKDFIKYKADSTVGNKEIDLLVHITKRLIKDEEKDTIYEVNHKRYKINNINLYVSKSFKNKNLFEFDTTSFKKVTIHYDSELKYRPRMLNHAVGLEKDRLYKLEDQKNTYKHFSELRVFKNINVSFEDVGDQKLNSNIFLVPAYTKSFSIEGVGTNNGGNLGIEGNLIYNNKNLFRGAEHFTIKLNGGLEAQQLINEDQKDFHFLGLPFNTLEFGPEINIEFPRFLLPVNLEKFSRKANPKTNLNLQLNYQKRPEYERTLTQVGFGYYWNQSVKEKHFINPINLSLIRLNPTPEFEQKLNEEQNPFILNSYQDHLINSTSYSYLFNNQRLNRRGDFTFFRFNVEFAGNIQSVINNLTDKPYDNLESESYNLLGIRYAQFVKTDLDLRFYEQGRTASLVSRINVGVGKPYGNLNVLPFEKSYFGGGANGIRAWQARSLGPGSIPDSLTENSLYQIGELKIEGNIEYRFDLTKIVESAIFVDAGNIWLLVEDPERPNAEFKVNRFWQDVAIGAGVGIRLDFNFFLIRFDLAAKLKDPSSSTPQRFDLQWRTPTLNLGIGYPF